MRCARCNSRITKRNKFCPECGAEVVWEGKANPQTNGMKRNYILIVIGILLLIAVVAVGVLIALDGVEGAENVITGNKTVAFSDDPEAIAAASQSVVKLNCYNKSGELYATGSGFAAFEKGIIITNYHVIEDKPKRIEIVTENGQKCEIGTGIAASIERDIAILYYQPAGTGFDLPLLPVGSTKPLQKGEKVVAIGSPLGLMNVVSTGVFSGYDNSEGITDIRFTASISSGSSGGALFNENGEVIGITYASYEAGQNLNLAVPVEFVEALWKEKTTRSFTLADFYDTLIPHYSVDFVLANYRDIKDTEFYLDYWASSYGKTADGYAAFCASNYNGIFDPAENVQEKRFQADMDRYQSSSLLKVVCYDKSSLAEFNMSFYFGKRGKEYSIKCCGVGWSQTDNKPFVLID